MTSVYVFVFFFKQKTAYEMRISDWSSDVCSSDLTDAHEIEIAISPHLIDDHVGLIAERGREGRAARHHHRDQERTRADAEALRERDGDRRHQHRDGGVREQFGRHHSDQVEEAQRRERARSEEHTSALQSHMRISYAVCCLK